MKKVKEPAVRFDFIGDKEGRLQKFLKESFMDFVVSEPESRNPVFGVLVEDVPVVQEMHHLILLGQHRDELVGLVPWYELEDPIRVKLLHHENLNAQLLVEKHNNNPLLNLVLVGRPEPVQFFKTCQLIGKAGISFAITLPKYGDVGRPVWISKGELPKLSEFLSNTRTRSWVER
jgi:hypothetical protein